MAFRMLYFRRDQAREGDLSDSAFNNYISRVPLMEKEGDDAQKQQSKKKNVNQDHKKVQFAEKEKSNAITEPTESSEDQGGRENKGGSRKKAGGGDDYDSFIQQRHKNFEVARWATFKAS